MWIIPIRCIDPRPIAVGGLQTRVSNAVINVLILDVRYITVCFLPHVNYVREDELLCQHDSGDKNKVSCEDNSDAILSRHAFRESWKVSTMTRSLAPD